jgi:hypothetical protein
MKPRVGEEFRVPKRQGVEHHQTWGGKYNDSPKGYYDCHHGKSSSESWVASGPVEGEVGSCNRLGTRSTNCIIIRGQCHGQRANLFVDTGSSVSIVAESFVRFIGRFKDVRPCKLKLTAFSGNTIKTSGEITLRVSIAGVTMDHTLVVADFAEAEILAGMDMMNKFGLNIDTGEKLVYSRAGSTNFKALPEPVDRCLKVRCKRTVTIPPYTSTHIEGRLQRPSKEEGNVYGRFEPYCNTVIGTVAFSAHAVVSSDHRKVPIRVVNPTEKPIVIY